MCLLLLLFSNAQHRSEPVAYQLQVWYLILTTVPAC